MNFIIYLMAEFFKLIFTGLGKIFLAMSEIKKHFKVWIFFKLILFSFKKKKKKIFLLLLY